MNKTDISDYDNGKIDRFTSPTENSNLSGKSEDWLRGWYDMDALIKASQARVRGHFADIFQALAKTKP